MVQANGGSGGENERIDVTKGWNFGPPFQMVSPLDGAELVGAQRLVTF